MGDARSLQNLKEQKYEELSQYQARLGVLKKRVDQMHPAEKKDFLLRMENMNNQIKNFFAVLEKCQSKSQFDALTMNIEVIRPFIRDAERYQQDSLSKQYDLNQYGWQKAHITQESRKVDLNDTKTKTKIINYIERNPAKITFKMRDLKTPEVKGLSSGLDEIYDITPIPGNKEFMEVKAHHYKYGQLSIFISIKNLIRYAQENAARPNFFANHRQNNKTLEKSFNNAQMGVNYNLKIREITSNLVKLLTQSFSSLTSSQQLDFINHYNKVNINAKKVIHSMQSDKDLQQLAKHFPEASKQIEIDRITNQRKAFDQNKHVIMNAALKRLKLSTNPIELTKQDFKIIVPKNIEMITFEVDKGRFYLSEADVYGNVDTFGLNKTPGWRVEITLNQLKQFADKQIRKDQIISAQTELYQELELLIRQENPQPNLAAYRK